MGGSEARALSVEPRGLWGALGASLLVGACGGDSHPAGVDGGANAGNNDSSVGGAGAGEGGSQNADSGAAGGGTGGGTSGTGAGTGGGTSGTGGGTSGAGGMGTGGLPSVGSCPLSETGLTLAATFRDFQAAHPDFEPSAPGGGEVVTGIVDDALGPDGVPVQVGSGPGITSEATFNQWFRDVPGVNAPIVRQLVLWNDGQGGYVNRWGSTGEQWESYENPVYCAIAATNCEACQPLGEGVRCLVPCDRFGTYECAINVVTYDGTPVFFPIDNAPGAITSLSEYSVATIPPAYGGLWQPEPGASPHNFHFTSEIRFWFRYNGTTHIIELLGDDDVWVFINGRLAIDLGGLHTPVGGTFTLDTNRATEFGLTSGQFYEVAIFHAERKTSGSSFMLRLAGFQWNAMRCAPP